MGREKFPSSRRWLGQVRCQAAGEGASRTHHRCRHRAFLLLKTWSSCRLTATRSSPRQTAGGAAPRGSSAARALPRRRSVHLEVVQPPRRRSSPSRSSRPDQSRIVLPSWSGKFSRPTTPATWGGPVRRLRRGRPRTHSPVRTDDRPQASAQLRHPQHEREFLAFHGEATGSVPAGVRDMPHSTLGGRVIAPRRCASLFTGVTRASCALVARTAARSAPRGGRTSRGRRRRAAWTTSR
jgi:hypothetical protein